MQLDNLVGTFIEKDVEELLFRYFETENIFDVYHLLNEKGYFIKWHDLGNRKVASIEKLKKKLKKKYNSPFKKCEWGIIGRNEKI